MLTDGRQTTCYRQMVTITLNPSKIHNPKSIYHEKAYNLFVPVCCGWSRGS
jgi:hypothetical protein